MLFSNHSNLRADSSHLGFRHIWVFINSIGKLNIQTFIFLAKMASIYFWFCCHLTTHNISDNFFIRAKTALTSFPASRLIAYILVKLLHTQAAFVSPFLPFWLHMFCCLRRNFISKQLPKHTVNFQDYLLLTFFIILFYIRISIVE